MNEYSQKIEIGSINLNDGIYSFVIDKPSSYSIQVLSELENSNFSSNKEYLVVSDFDIESEFLYQNKKSLYSFANKNNATYFDFKDLELSLDKIRINEVINVEQNNFNSLDTQYYWIFFIFLLTIEWYIRKKSKLL